GNQDIILKDNLTGTETDLKAGSYTFVATAGVDNARFSLKYQKTLGVNPQVFNENSILVYKNKGAIHIKSGKSVIDNVKIFDISGRLLFEKMKVNADQTSIESTKFNHQVLIVKITANNQMVSKKVVN
ncbi:MAG: T9SS sorting signal type C domain-containing protein, partial [Flavobacteriaceae bacterium]|nr:T9SS sorting signal type C domain-containing protein [Flavobacteriaceae bacterium]